jgi:3-hydroxyacyl-CoA dehydrogenase/enoyl-CoA hydratase/3-hydroxybutyryl-CoA epimerase
MDRAVATFGVFRRQVLAEADRKLRRESTPEQYPAPFRALEALEAAVTLPLSQGLDREAKIVGELVSGTTAKNLMWLLQNQASLRRSSQGGPALHSSGESRRESPERRRVGVIGAGLMGGGISRLVAEAGMRVRLNDRSWDPILASLRTNRKAWDQQVRNSRLTVRETEARIARITPTVDLSGFARCEFLIEAVEERLELKQKILASLEPLMADDAVYTSNTSSLPITEVAMGSARPDRVVGLHFFNPVERMPLVEVIAGAASSREAVMEVRDFAIRLGKVPVVVRDSPGFLVNRILMFYLGEAIRLLSEGVRIDGVDQAMVRFGMPLGPFTLMDGIGLDTVLQVARTLQRSFGKRAEGSTRTLESLIVSERYGQKKGGGFYRYRRGKRTLPDPEVYNLAEVGTVLSLPPETLQERMVLVMVNEAASCLAEQVVSTPAELDVAMVTGTGFPPFRGGLFRYADSIGIAVIVDRLNRLADAHGERFRPAGTLNDMVRAQQRFYGPAE